jgi:FkbM family methyltransferase
MSYYWDKNFLKHFDIKNIKTIFEIGARYGDETIKLKKIFPNSKIYSFECNPKTIDICNKNLSNIKDVYFNNFGLGDKECKLPFYSYIKNNDGCSSFLKRVDFNDTQIQTGIIQIKRMKDYVYDKNIKNIDLLCMDIQGYELNVLKGAGKFINNINYIIMEEPKLNINTKYLKNGLHSKYINSPTSQQIKKFMTENGFVEIERIQENYIEDNVMYKNNNYNNLFQ